MLRVGRHTGPGARHGDAVKMLRWAAQRGSEITDDVDWMSPPAGAIRSTFTAPSGELAMMSTGDPDGHPVVLIPGVTGSKEDFSLMMPGLAAAGFHVTSYDLAGQYQSWAAGPHNLVPPRKRFDYDLFVDDLIAVLDQQRHPVHVLGYSFAATLAQIALSRRPELFASLTLLSCPPEPGRGFRGVPYVGWFSRLSGGRMGAALLIWGIRRNFIKAPSGRMQLVRERFTLTRRQSVRDAFVLMKHAPDLRSMLAAWSRPKLVAVGEHDIWPARLHAKFASDIGATFHVYPGGHSPCETSPQALNQDLLDLFAMPAPTSQPTASNPTTVLDRQGPGHPTVSSTDAAV
jgi:pimeloyl-ACP methyl ester carboxylesterase